MPQRLPAATQQREAYQRIKIAHGFDFKNSYKKSKSSMTLSLIHPMTNKNHHHFRFRQALRQAEFSHARFVTLVSITVRSSVDYMGSSFRDNFRQDPRLDEDGKHSTILSKRYKGYKHKDPNESQQKAIPFCVVK